ncbi:hypothetical protein ACQZV8_14100 [Magnetococcales bacterium HHB-1]
MSKDSKQSRQLTEKQQYWLEHMLCIDREGGTIKSYAERHGLDLRSCYDWRSR